MNILMITKSRYASDVRVRREAESLGRDGHQVTVIAQDDGTSRVNNVDVIGIGETSGLSPRRPNSKPLWFRATRWLLLPEHRQRALGQFQDSVLAAASGLETSPDVIHAHDFPALSPAFELARRFSAKLVYDAHELWSGMARHGRPEPGRRRRNRLIEAGLARRADRVITVSDAGADLIKRELGVRDVTVVRNTFSCRDDLGPPSEPAGAVYAGRIGPGRDLETVLAAPIWHSGLTLHLMGRTDHGLGPPEHVITHPPGDMDEVERLLAAVGIGLVTLTDGPLNHRIALPNKLFQAVAAGVPVVATDLPQMASVVREHGIGALYTSGDAESLARAVRSVVEEYGELTANVRSARRALDWEVDHRRLADLYRSLDDRR